MTCSAAKGSSKIRMEKCPYLEESELFSKFCMVRQKSCASYKDAKEMSTDCFFNILGLRESEREREGGREEEEKGKWGK